MVGDPADVKPLAVAPALAAQGAVDEFLRTPDEFRVAVRIGGGRLGVATVIRAWKVIMYFTQLSTHGIMPWWAC